MEVKSIVFVGSNPTSRNERDGAGNLLPFKGTRSWSVLKGWIRFMQLGVAFIDLVNAYPHVLEGNRRPSRAQLGRYLGELKRACNRGQRVVALGKVAADALSMAGVPHFEMPHPSGLNKKLNDQGYVEEMLAKCRVYLSGGSEEHGEAGHKTGRCSHGEAGGQQPLVQHVPGREEAGGGVASEPPPSA